MIKINSRGLAEVEIIIPQGTTLQFRIVHKSKDGTVIDHTDSKLHFAMQGSKTYVLDEFCHGTSECIEINVPASFTEELPCGYMNCDFIAETEQFSQCLFYGVANIADTYSLDK